MRSFLIGCFLLVPLYLFAGSPAVRNTDRGIELRNGHVSILISNQAEMLSCVDINSNQDIASRSHKKMASVKLKGGATREANKIVLGGNTLSVSFGEKTVVMEVQAFDDYFTFEVKKAPSDIESLTFIDLRMKYDYAVPNPFLAVGVAMSLQTNPVYYPSGEDKRVIGRCASHTGIIGAKLALVACYKNDLREILKVVYNSVSAGIIPINKSSGGPFSLDSEANKFDCWMVRDSDPSKVPGWIDFCSKQGIRQIELMKGNTTFTQGQFSFPVSGSASVFKKQVSDPLYNAGIITTLHTYSFYIAYSENEILGNPKWQQQLEFRESFSLSKSISATDAVIDVKGDKSVLKKDESFTSVHTPYVLIDREIIKYTVGKNGFVSCKRGQCGTTAVSHKAGSKVRIIGGYYSHIAPQIGSELFYEIARRTARAYNEGGFRGFYFDALDGLKVHLKYAGLSDYLWYYGSTFINEVLKNCEREPDVIEYSTMFSTIWSARGRGIAFDIPKKGYKNFIDDHTKQNIDYINRQYVATLGWFNFYPVNNKQLGNYSTKYMFFDDVDYVGVKAIAYDQTMNYHTISEEDLNSFPALRRNLEEYQQYSRLKHENYFSDRVKSVLQEGKYEYKLIRKGGVWGFNEACYSKDKLRDITKDKLSGHNPFNKQYPFIRIENMYSSSSESIISLLRLDERTELNEQECKKTFQTPLDLSGHLGLKVSLKGNGRVSQDALCIRLCSSSSSGYADFVVRLNFDGWRDILLPNLDNAEFPDLIFEGMEDNLYRMHRKDVDFKNVQSIQIFKAGECKSVRIRSVEAVPLVSNTLTNPTIHLGNSSISFSDSLKSGEYLEYSVGDKKALVFDSIGNSREVKVSSSGYFRVPQGSFTATVSGIPELKNAPSEVVLTIGLYGEFIHN